MERKESRKDACDAMNLSLRYLANMENKGQQLFSYQSKLGLPCMGVSKARSLPNNRIDGTQTEIFGCFIVKIHKNII